MLQLFVTPTPFEGWGDRAYDGTSQRQLLAVLIVSVGALALTVCVALLMVFSGEPLESDPSRLHSLHYGQLGLLDNSHRLIVGHVDGTLELRGVLSAERWCLAIGPIQDGLRGTDTGCVRCTFIL